MTIKEKALAIYPKEPGTAYHSQFGTIEFDRNADKRAGFVEGYKQALFEVRNEILAYIETQAGGFHELLNSICLKLYE